MAVVAEVNYIERQLNADEVNYIERQLNADEVNYIERQLNADEVNYIERQLNACTILKLKGRYAVMFHEIMNVFEEKKLDVQSLMLHLCALDEDNVTIFSTDLAFKKIHSIKELFYYISKYCSVYDYEILETFVESTECEEAMKLLDDFTKELHSSVLSDLDLLGDVGELQGPMESMPKTHKLIIKYIGGKCTMETKELVQNIIYEHFHLQRGSIIFKGIQDDSDTSVYQISPTIKSHIQQYPITTKNVFPQDTIKSLKIDDKELKFPEQLQGKYIYMLDEHVLNGIHFGNLKSMLKLCMCSSYTN